MPDDRPARILHSLHCRDRLSLQAARQVLRESYAIDLDQETAQQAMVDFSCQHCAERAPEPPAAAQRAPEPPAASHWVKPGFLTGMLRPSGE